MTKDWMQINILVPNDIMLGPELLQILTDLGFTEADWCELEHRSGAIATYGYYVGDQPTHQDLRNNNA